MERRQALALALAALCAATNAHAAGRNWPARFNAAQSEQQCRAAYDWMTDRCDYEGISPGRQDKSAVRGCKSWAREMRDECVARLRNKAEEEAEEKEREAAKAAQKAEDDQAWQRIQKERAEAARDIQGKRPSLILGCSKMGGSRVFPATLEFRAFQDVNVCVFNGWVHRCSLSEAVFLGTVEYQRTWDSWRISRVTGEMSIQRGSMSRTSAEDQTASYTCDKVTPGATKF